jgi:hypothetical protein
MWYHMKSKTLEREYDEFQYRLEQVRKQTESRPNEQKRLLVKYLQRIQQELTSTETMQQIRKSNGDVRLLLMSDNLALYCSKANQCEQYGKIIELVRQRLLVWQNILHRL